MCYKMYRSRGSVLIYTVVSLVGVASVISLALDSAHVRMVKTQLQCAADAAARAGAQNLQSGVSAAQSAAVAAAAANSADGSSVVLNLTTDIDLGVWSNGSFTALAGGAQSGANAVRVRAARTAAKGTPVGSIFGAFLGIFSCDVTVQSTATGIATAPAGFIGYTGISTKNNTFFGGYKSSVTTTPTENMVNSQMRVGTNAYVNTQNNDTIDGDLILGPGATVSGPNVIGSTYQLSSAIPAVTLPTWSPGTNPGSVPQNYTISNATTLPGGSYWFTSLTLLADLTFSGPTIVYVNGPIDLTGVLAASSKIPGDLTIYQYGSTSFFDSGTNNNIQIFGRVFAPGSDLLIKNNLYFAGSGIFNSITSKNNASFFYDEQQGPGNGSYAVATVQ
jgi:hypothetical protein